MTGNKLLHYQILEKLGAGAMGEVYRAVDERTERTVALKVVARTKSGDTEGRARMLREARAAARLAHPHIVSLYAAEEVNGEIFLVQEFVEGETLRDRLNRGPLATHDVVRLAVDVSDALDHAHQQGVLHRDLKPENILVTADGRYKIADFGIARVDGAPTLTIDGSLLGTIAYMAPERLRGEAGDARSDLFALGAILYEAIGGRRAFDARGEAEALYAVMEIDPERFTLADRTMSEVQELAFSLLAKDPARRPASARDVRAALEDFRTTTRMSLRAPRRLRRWVAPVAGAAAVVALAAAGWIGRGHLVGEAEADPAVAVLLFNNVADPADAARTGSITGTLLVNVLAQAGGLNVLSTQSVLDALHHVRPSGGPTNHDDALAVAQRVHARRIVTGSILQTTPTLVVTAEVSDAHSGRVVHSARVEGAPGETIFQVVDALGSRLIEDMVPRGTRELTPVAQRSSGNIQAQRAYVDGLDALSRGDIERAVTALSNAAAMDPTFAQAHLQLAIAKWWSDDSQAADAAIANARMFGERLTPGDRDILEALAPLVHYDMQAAYVRFDRLAARCPGDKFVQYGLVEAAFHSGRPARTLQAARAALVVDPDFELPVVHLVDALSILGRGAEAEREARRVIARDPHNTLLWSSLFQVALRAGDPERALRIAREARAAGGDARLRSDAGHLSVALDSVATAATWLTPDPSFSAYRARDIQTAYRYKVLLHRGRFAEALALARRMWATLPPIQEEGAPLAPLTYGIPAAIHAGDPATAVAWTDSIAARAREKWGREHSHHQEAERIIVRAEVGQIDEAARLLRDMEASPDFRGPEAPRPMHYARASLYVAQHRPLDALREYEKMDRQCLGFSEYNSVRYLYALAEIHAGRYATAAARLDSVETTPGLPLDRGVLAAYWQGVAWEKAGRPREAFACYTRFARKWKDAQPVPPQLLDARAALRRLSASAS